jgi:hypothetical protein
MKIFNFPYNIENTTVFECVRCRRFDEKACKITKLRTFTYRFFTCFQQEMWKIALLCLVAACLVGPAGCSAKSKGTDRPEQSFSSADQTLRGSGPTEVRKKLGEPTTISRTPEGRLYWIYAPAWKLIPNEKGTVYVEFENDKVAKVFKIK